MNKNLFVSRSIRINSTPEIVWNALTNPNKIKEYLFDTKVLTDWKVGSPIMFQGVYNGKVYSDKGKVTKNRIYELLQYDYWSSFSGLEDKSENYSIVTYQIKRLDEQWVTLVWYQSGFTTIERQKHAKEQIHSILEKIKQISETEDSKKLC